MSSEGDPPPTHTHTGTMYKKWETDWHFNLSPYGDQGVAAIEEKPWGREGFCFSVLEMERRTLLVLGFTG